MGGGGGAQDERQLPFTEVFLHQFRGKQDRQTHARESNVFQLDPSISGR